MSTTRLPASASEAARFSAVVVLPSEGDEPVIITERICSALGRGAVSVARKVRKASTPAGESWCGAIAFSLRALLSSGIRARIGRR
jgi:hypothetical protein